MTGTGHRAGVRTAEAPAGGWALGPAAWLAPQIGPEAYVYRLTPQDLEALDAAVRRAFAEGDDGTALSPDQFRLGAFRAPLETIGRCLRDGLGFGVVRGLPVDRYSEQECEVLLRGLGAHLGRVMPQSAAGEVLHHVRAQPGAAARGYQSGSALPFHSDSCDIVGLLCLRAARHGGESAIASAWSIHNALRQGRPDVLATLYEPFHIDRHGEQPQGAAPAYATPVFMWHGGLLFSRFNPGYVQSAQRYPQTPGLTSAQMEAMEVFAQHCEFEAFRLDMNLARGDLQLLNNNRIVHARSAYEDDPRPGRQRHLLRLWLFTSAVEDLPQAMRERYADMERWQAGRPVAPAADA